jgi:hypothetical protein
MAKTKGKGKKLWSEFFYHHLRFFSLFLNIYFISRKLAPSCFLKKQKSFLYHYSHPHSEECAEGRGEGQPWGQRKRRGTKQGYRTSGLWVRKPTITASLYYEPTQLARNTNRRRWNIITVGLYSSPLYHITKHQWWANGDGIFPRRGILK